MNTRNIKENFQKEKPEMITACEALQILLSRESEEYPAAFIKEAAAYNTNEMVGLKKAKYACSLNMVVHPYSTNTNIFFTTKENFQRMLKAKESRENVASSTPRQNP